MCADYSDKTFLKLSINYFFYFIYKFFMISFSITRLKIPEIIINYLKNIKSIYEKIDGFTEDTFCFGMIKPLPDSTLKKQNYTSNKKSKTTHY